MRVVFPTVIIVGLGTGAALGWLIGGQQAAPVPVVELYVSLQGDTQQIGTMDSGWGPSSTRGSPLAGVEATLSVPIAGSFDRDYLIDIETTGEPRRNEPPVEVRIQANGQDIGSVILGAARVKRLFLPQVVATRSRPLKFKFSSKRAPSPTLLISSLTLRDISILKDFAGNLDGCSGRRIFGWSTSGRVAAPVIIRRHGVRAIFVLPTVNRPDLSVAGMPPDAGFEVTLDEPIKSGEKIEVLFPNGKPLGGAECKA